MLRFDRVVQIFYLTVCQEVSETLQQGQKVSRGAEWDI